MIELFFAEFKRGWLQFRRYAAEAATGITIVTIFFYGLVQGARYIAGPSLQFGDRLDAIIVGYVLWTLTFFVIGDISGGLQSEAQTGTLEQLFLSPFSASQLFLTRAIASMMRQSILNVLILGIILLLTQRQLAFPPVLLLPFTTVLLGAYGLAFITGSLTLLLKRIQQLLGIFNFVLLFLLTAPIETWTGQMRTIGWLLPMAPGAGLLRDVMARDLPLDWGRFAIALLNGTVYLLIGLWLFRQAERETRRRGSLGGY